MSLIQDSKKSYVIVTHLKTSNFSSVLFELCRLVRTGLAVCAPLPRLESSLATPSRQGLTIINIVRSFRHEHHNTDLFTVAKLNIVATGYCTFILLRQEQHQQQGHRTAGQDCDAETEVAEHAYTEII